MQVNRSIAYFSMEIALNPAMPTYSGGLGVLAGDTLRAAADRNLPMVAVTLLHRKGYFSQALNESGWQTETPNLWDIATYVRELPQRVSIEIEGRKIQLRVWQYDVCGVSGGRIPVFLLDTDLPENTEWDRSLTEGLKPEITLTQVSMRFIDEAWHTITATIGGAWQFTQTFPEGSYTFIAEWEDPDGDEWIWLKTWNLNGAVDPLYAPVTDTIGLLPRQEIYLPLVGGRALD